MDVLDLRHQLHVGANQVVIHVKLDVFSFEIDSHKRVEAAALELPCDFLADDILEILKLWRNFDVQINISMVDTFNLNQYGEDARLGPGRAKPGHAVDHELTACN